MTIKSNPKLNGSWKADNGGDIGGHLRATDGLLTWCNPHCSSKVTFNLIKNSTIQTKKPSSGLKAQWARVDLRILQRIFVCILGNSSFK
jgi:hypothetical protein